MSRPRGSAQASAASRRGAPQRGLAGSGGRSAREPAQPSVVVSPTPVRAQWAEFRGFTATVPARSAVHAASSPAGRPRRIGVGGDGLWSPCPRIGHRSRRLEPSGSVPEPVSSGAPAPASTRTRRAAIARSEVVEHRAPLAAQAPNWWGGGGGGVGRRERGGFVRGLGSAAGLGGGGTRRVEIRWGMGDNRNKHEWCAATQRVCRREQSTIIGE